VTVHYSDVYTLDEAAARLALSPRRLAQLLASGVVQGERHGRSWLVPAAVLDAPPVVPVAVGRPFGARLAWALLATLEGREVPYALAREERARIARHLERPLQEIFPRLRGRATSERLSVGVTALDELIDSGRFVVGGARALRLVGSSRAAAVDLYLPKADYDDFLDESLAVPDPTYPNLVVHLVEPRHWPFQPGEAAWTSAALLDLYEAGALAEAAVATAYGNLGQLRRERAS
jgi:hypothetical protein